RLVEGAHFRERDDRGARTVADDLRTGRASVEVAEHETLDGFDIAAGAGAEPFVKLGRLERQRSDAFTAQRRGIARANGRPAVDDHIHSQPPNFSPNAFGTQHAARSLRAGAPTPQDFRGQSGALKTGTVEMS